MEPTVVITILGILIILFLILGTSIKPVRFVSQGIVKLLMGAFFLFFLNVLGTQFGIHIPINFVTSAVSGFLGVPGLCALVAIEVWIM